MAGDRLEYWSTLPPDEIRRRCDEETRRTDLTFPEQQLLDAALESLRGRRAPIIRSKTMKNDDVKPVETTETENPATEHSAQATDTQEKTMTTKTRKAAAKSASKSDAKAKARTPVRGKAKTAAKAAKVAKPAKAARANKASAGTRSRIAPDAKIVWTKKANPFKEGSGGHKRTEAVIKMSGKTFAEIRPKVRATTVGNLIRAGVVKVA